MKVLLVVSMLGMSFGAMALVTRTANVVNTATVAVAETKLSYLVFGTNYLANTLANKELLAAKKIAFVERAFTATEFQAAKLTLATKLAE